MPASACPHYDGEALRPAAYRAAITQGMCSGYAADDSAALHFKGTQLVEAVASRPTASAYHLELQAGQLTETRLPTRFLGSQTKMD